MSLILHDENHWEGGRLFRPERHLEAGGTSLRKDDHFIPFSTGKRQCLGETLAKSELFLFFTGLLHQFHILAERPGLVPSQEAQEGLTQLPLPFKVILKPRSEEITRP